MEKLLINNELINVRLDKALTTILEGKSRSYIGKMIDENFFAGGTELLKGDSLPMHTASISFNATIISVEEGN